MSNRTMTERQVMETRWENLMADMEKEGIDCLLMHSGDRIFSSYLRYVTDIPVSLYPMSALFSKKGISLVGHGVEGVPLLPVPQEGKGKGAMHFHNGNVRVHGFVKDLIGVPACPTTTRTVSLWADAICQLIRQYDYQKIGIVGMNTVPFGIIQRLQSMPLNLEFVDATALVDGRKCVKSPCEIAQARACAKMIDELMHRSTGVIRPGKGLRQIGKEIRAMADDLDCMDLNIMLGKHPTRPMFSEWIFTDDEVVTERDCIELMVEVSSDVGFWGECARVYSLGEPDAGLKETVRLAFDLQEFTAEHLLPGADPSEIYRQYCEKLAEHGYPPEKRFFCHGQGYDVVELPFIRPEYTAPIQVGSIVAIHPSLYAPGKESGCFVCDNFIITGQGAKPLNAVAKGIICI